MDDPAELMRKSPDGRAGYVVERLSSSDLFEPVSDDDWTQIRTQLTSAYRALDKWGRIQDRRDIAGLILAAVVSYAVLVCLQWSLDAAWLTGDLSFRTFVVPVVVAVQIPFLFIGLVMLVFLVKDAIDGDPDASTLTWVAVAGAVWPLTMLCLVWFFDYSWTQAIIIAIVEPLAWVAVFALAVQTAEIVLAPTRIDPRTEFVADLAALLAATAVTLHNTDSDAGADDQELDGDRSSPSATQIIPMDSVGGDASVSPAASSEQPPDPDISNLRTEDSTDWIPIDSGTPRFFPFGPREDPLPDSVRLWPGLWEWREDGEERRALASRIEQSADHIELGLPRLAGRRETVVRSSVRHIAARVAATLRDHATGVILGGTELDRQLPEKLSRALVAASWGRWDELAAEEAQPAVERFLNRFGWRIAIAALLIAIGILIPIWFHELLADSTAQFRIALFSAAVLGITEAPKAAVEKLTTFAQSAVNRRAD